MELACGHVDVALCFTRRYCITSARLCIGWDGEEMHGRSSPVGLPRDGVHGARRCLFICTDAVCSMNRKTCRTRITSLLAIVFQACSMETICFAALSRAFLRVQI